MQPSAASRFLWIVRFRIDLFLLSVLSGCAIGAYVPVSWWWCVVGGGVFFFGAIFVRKNIVQCIAACCALFFIIGLFRGELALAQRSGPPKLTATNAQVTITGAVVAEPRISKFNQQIRLSLEHMEEPQQRPLEGFAVIETGFTPRIHAGERIVVSCRAKPASTVSNVSYAAYLRRMGVSDVCTSGVIQDHQPIQGSVVGIAARVRERVAQAIHTALPSPESDFLGGILIGADQQFPQDIKAAFQTAGLTHLVAVSGSNITLMIFFLETFLGALGMSRKSRFGVLGLFVVAFTLVTGASSSAVRAMWMGLLGVTALQLGRGSMVLRTILLAGTVMAFIDPSVVLFDLSFQLSFLATLGLVYLAPTLERVLVWVPDQYSLRALLAQTLAAILATEPLILYHFGTLSLIAPLMNVLVVPLIPLIMAMGSMWLVVVFSELWIGILLGGVLPLSLEWVFAWPAWALLHLVLLIISIASNIPFASVTLPPGPLLAVIIGVFYGLTGYFLIQSRGWKIT